MENPLGLLRSQIYRLFNGKSEKNAAVENETPSLQYLKTRFPWANDKELEVIRKERLYLDADFSADAEGSSGTQSGS